MNNKSSYLQWNFSVRNWLNISINLLSIKYVLNLSRTKYTTTSSIINGVENEMNNTNS